MTYCNASSQPTMLKDSLSATASQSIPSKCWSQWTVGFYTRHLTTYRTSITHQFGYYFLWAKTSVGSALSDFMDIEIGNGNAFLYCKSMKSDTGSAIVTCTQITLISIALEFWDLHYTLIAPVGFYTATASQLGMERDQIAFGDWEVPRDCVVLKESLAIIPRAVGPGGSSRESDIVVTTSKTGIEAAMPNTWKM
ncbi:uncharacterized protein Bfra_001051 [Botrytis fragariae]|uniref:Uncharacterized protein n=1 Tax=Botrytis fragariae TaxID=1964551 RepID=A0A8H6ENY1_9HELO|nr:uncharacterized protein Bfra_001051 [Botrytis fragariae]KAF5878880.1 hypothetical protein Bfra_001051 [Botrytis fragariae]